MNPFLLAELQTPAIRDEVEIALNINSPKRLHKAFTWAYTEEGGEYWSAVTRAKTLSPEAREKLLSMLKASAKRPPRGFAAMDPERQREIARMGGRAVDPAKRSFSQNNDLARRAGRKGGLAVDPAKRNFSVNREMSIAAGRKGGLAKTCHADESSDQ